MGSRFPPYWNWTQNHFNSPISPFVIYLSPRLFSDITECHTQCWTHHKTLLALQMRNTTAVWRNRYGVSEHVLRRRCSGKESTCQCRRRRRWVFDPWVRKVLWSRKWHPAPIFLPGESHGQRSLVGYSPWGHKESEMTENTHSIYYGSVEGHLLSWRNLWKKLGSS